MAANVSNALTSLGWAFVGAGSHVWRSMGRAAAEAKDTFLTGIYAPNEREARRCADHFGFAKTFVGYRELLQDPAVDVVYIATPNILHFEQAMLAIEAGKHVLVEKPLALTRNEGSRLLERSREQRVVLGVGYHLRQHPAHQEIARLVQQGAIGSVRFGLFLFGRADSLRGGWWSDPARAGAYIMSRRGIHLIDLVIFIAGVPVRVAALTNGQRRDRELEDTAVALLELPGDSFITLAASRELTNCPDELALYGTAGLVRAVGTFGGRGGGALLIDGVGGRRSVDYDEIDLYKQEIETFNRRILSDDRNDPTAAAGVLGLGVLEGILRSARSRQMAEL